MNIALDLGKQGEGKYNKNSLSSLAMHLDNQVRSDGRCGNENIDPSKTHLNFLVPVGKSENHDLQENVKLRLGDVKTTKKLRSDAVLVREIILQPSSDFFDDCKTDEERQRKSIEFTAVVSPWIFRNFGGYENIVNMNGHLDETNFHLHVGICPVTEDGRLSQKDFFISPKHYKELHQSLREYMNEQGYNFDLENKNHDGTRGYTTKYYQEHAEEIERERELINSLSKRETDLSTLESSLNARRAKLDQREEDISRMELENSKRANETLENANEVMAIAQQQLKAVEEEKKLAEEERELATKRFRKAMALNRQTSDILVALGANRSSMPNYLKGEMTSQEILTVAKEIKRSTKPWSHVEEIANYRSTVGKANNQSITSNIVEDELEL